MRTPLLFAFVASFFTATAALADPPPAFQYNVLASEGRGLEVCDIVWGSLLQTSNRYYLTFQPGMQPRDALRGDYDGTMMFNASPGVTVPFWEDLPLGFLKQNFPAMAADFDKKQMKPGKDYIIRRSHFDLEADNHGQEVYQLVLPHGTEFPRLFTDDSSPQVQGGLERIHASYAFTLKQVIYLMVRVPGTMEIWQFSSDHGKHNGKGPIINQSRVCTFKANPDPQPAIEAQQGALKANQNNVVKN